MNDIFFFDSMLTPKIIIFIYWLGLISVVSARSAPCSAAMAVSGQVLASCCSA